MSWFVSRFAVLGLLLLALRGKPTEGEDKIKDWRKMTTEPLDPKRLVYILEKGRRIRRGGRSILHQTLNQLTEAVPGAHRLGQPRNSTVATSSASIGALATSTGQFWGISLARKAVQWLQGSKWERAWARERVQAHHNMLRQYYSFNHQQRTREEHR